jgi:putative colanic acid biosynthesis glycosyltransferase
MKKIFQINIEVNSGSTGRIAEQIGIVAINNGFESYITYARGYNPSLSKTIKIGNKVSLLSHLLKTRIFGEHLNGSYFATKSLIRKIKALNPDIIHLHQLHGYFLNVPLLFKFLKKYNKPVVWTLHDCWAFTGHCSYFTVAKCDKWLKQCSNCPQLKKYPKSLFFDKSYSEYNSKKQLFNEIKHLTLVGVSNWVAELAKLSFLKNKVILSIPNGVNTKVFTHKQNQVEILDKYGLVSKNRYIIAAGTTWIKTKGLEDYKALSEILPDDVKLILVGINDELAKLMPSSIYCIPRTESQEELANLYSASEILLCLSYQESFGMTPIEAMSCGTPMIVYNNTALTELVDVKTGRIVNTGDVNAVKNAIVEMLEIGKNSFSSACLNKAHSKYGIETTYLKYIELYQTLVNNK